MKLRREFTFDAAHNLVHYHGKCERLHGHTYRVAVVLDGVPDDEGMILDFSVLSDVVKERAISKLDHVYINELIPQPTAENIAIWIWNKIEEPLRRPNCRLAEVWVWETAASCAVLTEADRALLSKP